MTYLKNRLIYFLFLLTQWLKIKKTTSIIPSRILVVSTTGLGDSLWATPALASIKKSFPNSYLAILTSPIGKNVFAENPHIDNIYTIKHKGISQLFPLFFLLKKERFDTALIFHLSQRFTLPLVYFSSIGKIVGTSGINKGLDFLLTHPINKRYEHEIERRLSLCKQLGPLEEETDLKLYLSLQDKEKAQLFLDSLKPNKRLIGIHPGAKDKFKQWPPSFFGRLIQLLEKRLDAQVILTGDASELSLTSEIAAFGKNVVNLAGKFSLKETAALIEKLDLYLTNDTGPMHMGFAMNTKVLALFSPTDPFLCGPFKNKNSLVISYPKTCLFCLNKKCREPFCMRQISVEEVFSKVQTILR